MLINFLLLHQSTGKQYIHKEKIPVSSHVRRFKVSGSVVLVLIQVVDGKGEQTHRTSSQAKTQKDCWHWIVFILSVQLTDDLTGVNVLQKFRKQVILKPRHSGRFP